MTKLMLPLLLCLPLLTACNREEKRAAKRAQAFRECLLIQAQAKTNTDSLVVFMACRQESMLSRIVDKAGDAADAALVAAIFSGSNSGRR